MDLTGSELAANGGWLLEFDCVYRMWFASHEEANEYLAKYYKEEDDNVNELETRAFFEAEV